MSRIRQIKWEGQFPQQGELTHDEAKRLRQYWRTPESFVEALESYLGGVFVLDLCAATSESGVCKHAISESDDVFRVDIAERFDVAKNSEWNENVDNPLIYMNPPYANPGKYLQRAIEACEQAGVPVVCLLKGDTSTSWFEEYVWRKAARIILPSKRISHDKPDYRSKGNGGNNFASIVAVYHPDMLEYGNKREVERMSIGVL